MPKLEIPVITDLNKKTSDIDLPITVARKCVNLSTTEQPGALVKTNFYTDVSSSLVSSLPAGHTLQNIFEFSITDPEDKQVFLIHTKKGGADHLLMGPSYQPSFLGLGSSQTRQFNSAWVDLLEREETVVDAMSVHNDLIISGLANLSITDYYLGWYVRVLDINGTGVNVDGVCSGGSDSNSLKFPDNTFSGIASGETVIVSRAPFVLNSGDDGFPVVDDIIRFLKRESTCLLITGNTNEYPTQIQGLLSYIAYRIFLTTSVIAQVYRFNLDMEQAPKPYASASPAAGTASPIVFSNITTTEEMTDGDWELAYAFEYDGFQIGPLSEVFELSKPTTQGINIEEEYAYHSMRDSGDANWIKQWADGAPGFYQQLIGDRVTGVYIFGKIPGETTFKLFEADEISGATQMPMPIRESIFKEPTLDPRVHYDYTDGYFTQLSGFDTKIIFKDPTGPTYEELVGKSQVFPNYKYSVATDNHYIAAAIHNKDAVKQDNDLIASTVSSDGVPNYNMYGSGNIINLGFYGTKKITGIAILGDIQTTQSPKARIAVFAEDTYWILQLTPGASFGHALDRPGQKEGLIAPNSLVAAEGFLFGLSRNGFRMFDVGGTQIIGEGLKPDIDALTTPEDCFAVYHKNARKVIFYFKADNKAYYIDMLSEKLGMFELTFSDTLNALAPLNDGSFLSVSNSKIFRHGTGNKQDDANIVVDYKTAPIDSSKWPNTPRHQIISLKYGSITYRSDTPIRVQFFLDRNVSALSMPNVSFPGSSVLKTVEFAFPFGSTCKEIEIGIDIEASYLSTNTYFVVENQVIDAVVTKSIKR